jgi:four helix bundle protein
MSQIQSYRDLIVWQKSMDLAEMVYLKSQNFPADERFGLTSQIRRSSTSIPSNIAEGYGRRSTGDYKRFLNISVGSKNECLTQVELSFRLGFLNENDFKQLMNLGEEISKMLNALISKL